IVASRRPRRALSSGAVISASSMGWLASRAADRSSVSSRWRWKLWKVKTELCKASRISSVTCSRTRWRTTSKVAQVSEEETRSNERRNLVRSRPFGKWTSERKRDITCSDHGGFRARRKRRRRTNPFSPRTSGFWLAFFGCCSERRIHGGPDRHKLVAGAVDGSDVDGIRRV